MGVDVQYFDWKDFRTDLALITYEKIELYDNLIRMGSDGLGGKHTVKVHPDDGNLDEVLEFICGQKVLQEEISANTIDDYHSFAVIKEHHKDTTQQYKGPWITLVFSSLCQSVGQRCNPLIS